MPSGLKAQAVPPDSIVQNTDTIRVSAARKGGVETTINYSARDSIRFDVVQKIMYLFGDAKIDYGATSLTAEQIQINWETSTLYANGVPDSAGKLIGTPVFKDEEQVYEAEKIAYNYKTKKGKISGAVTKQGEGYIHAETVKKNADNELFGQNAQYTTCDLKHPHFFINASKMKVEPGKKVITGPFNLWIGDVPTPVGFLFGLFPTPKKRASGVIIPTFGETRDRGFYLRNGGYYWAVNDYLGLRFMGDVYSLGDYGASIHGDYYKRYKYRGNFSLEHSTFKDPEQIQDDATVGPPRIFRPERKTYWVRWYHSPEALGGRGRFTASVNAGSSSYNKINATDPGQYLSSTFQSAVSYSRTLPYAPISYDIRASHFQNVQTNEVTFNLPDFTLSTNSLYPFRWLTPEVPTGAWWENITNQAYFTYRLNAQNRFSNIIGNKKGDTLDFPGQFGDMLQEGQYGARHDFNISLGSYKLFKYFNFSPTVTYEESWQLRSLDYTYDAINDSIITDTLTGFNRIYNYAAGASLSTQFYGIYNFKGKKIKAIRHAVNPVVAYYFSPDFGDPKYDYYETLPRVNTNPREFQQLSRYAGLLYQAPSPLPQSALAFSLRNSIEMKKVSKTDTVSGFDKVKLIDNLTASGNYNFALDSFNLSNLLIQMNTNLFNRLGVNLQLEFDPYRFYNGRRVNEFQINEGNFSLARFIRASIDLSTDLNPENWRKEKRVSANAYPIGPETQPTQYPLTATLPEYVDFDIKWSLYLGFNATYFNPDYFPDGTSQNRNVTVRGTVNPSEKWKVQFWTGYDMVNKDISFTKIDLYRDLHCWEMSIGWTPFGYAQGYYVNINVKSSILRDLKISRQQTFQNR